MYERPKRNGPTSVSDGVPMLTVTEVATYLSVSGRSVNRMLENGMMRGSRIGGQWRILQSDVDDLVEGFSNESIVRDNFAAAVDGYAETMRRARKRRVRNPRITKPPHRI